MACLSNGPECSCDNCRPTAPYILQILPITFRQNDCCRVITLLGFASLSKHSSMQVCNHPQRNCPRGAWTAAWSSRAGIGAFLAPSRLCGQALKQHLGLVAESAYVADVQSGRTRDWRLLVLPAIVRSLWHPNRK